MTAVADPRAVSPLVATVLSSFEDAASLRDEWDALAAELRAPAPLSFDHCAIWWRRYGAGRELALFVFRAEGALVGVVPTFVERVRLGPVSLRVGGLVGADSTPIVLDLPVRAEHARAAFDVVLRRLLDDARCDVARISPLAGASPCVDAALAAARALDDRAAIVRDARLAPQCVIELPATFDAYLASLDKKQRGNWRRAMKCLRAEHEVVADAVEDAASLDVEFPKFVAMHEAQWRAEGKLGHFRDWPGAEAYHAELLRAHAARGRAHLLRLSLSGETVAYQLCWSFGDTLHWVLPARVLREDLERHSLGRIGLVQIVEFAIAAGFRRVECGIGRYDYKVQLGAEERDVRSVVVARTGRVAAARIALFSRLARALDFLYYRVWFQRVAPRLPLPRRPLWRTWIRSRP